MAPGICYKLNFELELLSSLFHVREWKQEAARRKWSLLISSKLKKRTKKKKVIRENFEYSFVSLHQSSPGPGWLVAASSWLLAK
jgi:hypothetical protein